LTGEGAERSTAVGGFLDRVIETARTAGDELLPDSIEALQFALNRNKDMPLRAKRKGQAFLAELQAKLKTWEKSQRASSAATIDVGSVTDKLLSEAPSLAGGKLVVAIIAGANDDQLRAGHRAVRDPDIASDTVDAVHGVVAVDELGRDRVRLLARGRLPLNWVRVVSPLRRCWRI
jgi:hypothetical protein